MVGIRADEREDRGVSPVIGMILMVAITVVLAAVVGASVLGVQEKQSIEPQAHWDETENRTASGQIDDVTIEHTAGEPVPTDEVKILVGDEELTGPSDSAPNVASHSWPSGDEATAGDEFHVDFDSGVSEGTEVWIVWEPNDPEVDDSTVLYKYRLPADTADP